MYGWRGSWSTCSALPSSTISPAYNTPTLEHILRITPRLWLMKSTAVWNSAWSLLMRSRTSASTVASRPVVGSSRISSAGSTPSAIAITMRCCMPPES